jgi:CheY-like chemotaxis protein
VEAANADSALDLLDVVEDLSAILSDVIMPGDVDGTELARKAAENHPGVAVVLMSGNLDEGDHLKKAPLNTPLLRKPFSNLELSEALSGKPRPGKKMPEAAK